MLLLSLPPFDGSLLALLWMAELPGKETLVLPSVEDRVGEAKEGVALGGANEGVAVGVTTFPVDSCLSLGCFVI